MAACGYAAAWGLFAMIDILPFGWRFMYIVGALGFVFLAMVRRNLPETRRFVRLDKPESPLKPFVSLIRMYPGRIAALGATLMLISLGSQAPSFFDPKYLQEAHGWTPGQVSLMALIGGALIVFVPTYAGWFSDQFGRKRVTMFLLAVYPALIIGFYNSSGILLPVFWILYVAVGVGMTITLATYGVELFPTSYRSTATGAQSILLNVGAVMSLALESVLFDLGGSHWVAVSLLSMAIILTPLILMRFPETSRRALEDIAPER
jgi:putative MFS transporter